MDILKAFFSFFVDTITVLTSVITIWTIVKSPESVKETLQSLIEYFQNPQKAKQLKQIESKNTFLIPDSIFDPPREISMKSMAERQSQKRLINYLYILAGLIIIPIILTVIANPQTITLPEISPSPTDWTPSGGMNVVSLFWMYVCLFGIIGAMRGWAKELLVIFSSVVALTLNFLLRKYFPLIKDFPENSISLFWIQSIILFVLVYFGYQTVVSISHLASRAVRERLQDSMFGAVMGGINGYFIAGSILFYFHRAEYPYENIISPATNITFLEIMNKMMIYMPPALLGEPGIYFAVILMVIFIVVVYI